MSTLVALVVTGSVLALGAVLAGSATHTFRLAPVLSGSMTPTIPKGSLVMAEPIATKQLQVGDVLLFQAPVQGHPLVMHRIFSISDVKGTRVYRTKGDANAAPDVWSLAIKQAESWRVAHALPHLGALMGWLSYPYARVAVLVIGVVLLLVWGLRAIWSAPAVAEPPEPPVSITGPPTNARRVRRPRHGATVAVVGFLVVAVVGMSGRAFATFTNTPTAPAPAYGTGALGMPSGITCKWTSATQLSFGWTDATPTFTTGYNVQRSNTSGSGYSSIATPTPESNTTFVDAPPTPVTTQRYYVVDATRNTWSSQHSAEVRSGLCTWAINTTAGGNGQGYSGDGGPATAAALANPQSLAVAPNGDIYISDTTNNVIRKVTAATGIITTVAGGGTTTACTYAGSPTGVKLNAPDGVTVDDATGDVYISDTNNHCIRKLSGGAISQVAGGGTTTTCSYNGAPTGVKLTKPQGVNFDNSGTLYIADTGNNCIRKLSGGAISQVAGGGATTSCTYTGAATGVSISAPDSVKHDNAGNVYIADTGNNCIRKVTNGIVSQVAGGGATTSCTYTGSATGVSLSSPKGIGIDAQGRIIVADSGRRCLRIITGTNVSQYAGTGTNTSTGDGGPAIAATTGNPTGIAIAPDGSVYFSGQQNDSIRHIEGTI